MGSEKCVMVGFVVRWSVYCLYMLGVISNFLHNLVALLKKSPAIQLAAYSSLGVLAFEYSQDK